MRENLTFRRGIQAFVLAIFIALGVAALPAPAHAADASAGDYSTLQAAIASAPGGNVPYAIDITNNIVFPSGAALSIGNGKNITIQSYSLGAGAPYKLTKAQTDTRHFNVSASLTLANIILDGSATGSSANATGGGVSSSGKLFIQAGAIIQNCSNSGNGGGVNATAGTVEINGGIIDNNKSPPRGRNLCFYYKHANNIGRDNQQ